MACPLSSSPTACRYRFCRENADAYFLQTLSFANRFINQRSHRAYQIPEAILGPWDHPGDLGNGANQLPDVTINFEAVAHSTLRSARQGGESINRSRPESGRSSLSCLREKVSPLG